MARNVVTHFIDDIDGSVDDVKPVSFTYGGNQYTIDLSEANRKRLDDQMSEWIAFARRHRGNPQARTRSGYGQAKVIRAWAAKRPEWEKFAKPTGRLPNQLMEAYFAWVEEQRKNAEEK